MKNLYIFLNNKLVSCDTIIPVAIEVKKKSPHTNIIFFVFEQSTYQSIIKNITISTLITKIGKLTYLGWNYNLRFKPARILIRLFHLILILFNTFIFKNKVIHFKYLEIFPWNLVYFINRKNTFLFESNCWGYDNRVSKIYYDYEPHRILSDLYKNYNTLVYFGKKWPQIKHAYKYKKKKFFISPTRRLKSWHNEIEIQKKLILKKKLAWYSNKKKGILFTLGWMGHSHMYKKGFTGEDIFKETVNIIINHTKLKIIIKPHATTDLNKLKKLIKTHYKKRIFIDFNHVSVLSSFLNITISNYPSLTMGDAYINGSNVIEYSDYSAIMKDLCKNKSLYDDYVDFFIKRNPKKLIMLLQKSLKRKKYNSKYKMRQDTEKLIKYLIK